MGTIKTRPAMFSNINTRNGRIDASQPDYTIKIQGLIELQCLRSKCHLKQNLIPS